ncbi:MAG: family 20 glycosylhydrolase [Kiritimatiellae bacterium]|nr:family 20 glycosylhydrolase [Kiritimatiellia bacterium]
MSKVFVKLVSVAVVAVAACSLKANTLNLLLPKPVKAEARPGMVSAADCAKVKIVRAEVTGAPGAVANEAYILDVAADGVTITASDLRGERYARTTLDQLLKLGNGKAQCCRITDWPMFRWRGFLNDTGRNYLEMEGLKAILDVMAMYKMNIFHWHLTDYHGWRLESKKYPCLQRPEAILRQKGKYYTQEQFKEIVAYAWERGITVMPEFDVPGHSLAFRIGMGIGTMREPGTEIVISDLIKELCSLAPAEVMPFIHLGTDEVRTYPEYCDLSWLTLWTKTVNDCGRKAVVWAPGMKIEEGHDVIDMAWYDEYVTNSVNPYIYADYRRTYHGSWTPFDVLSMAAFGDMAKWKGESYRQIGAITSCWHDDNVGEDNMQLFRDCMIFPVIVGMSDNFWSGRKADYPGFRRRLPFPGTKLFEEAVDLERRIVAQRDKTLSGFKYPFPFVRQTQLRWKMTDVKTGKVIAKDIAQGSVWVCTHGSSEAAFVKRQIGTVALETWIKSPDDRTIGAWIDCQGMFGAYSRLPIPHTPRKGQWNCFGATISLNGENVPPPDWKQPGMKSTTPNDREQDIPFSTDLLEKPLVDELFTLRPPTRLKLKKGWNHVRIVLPSGYRWGASFCPVSGTSEHPHEVEGLEYSSEPPQK